jgi:beta-N-acetylhexosaminidase
VATVRKLLQQLQQVDLLPFFSVTGSAVPAELADGLLVSHIRYQGFQGNIRATTRPVSLDTAALSQIIGLEQFTAWRGNGGLIVSDALGSQAVRDFYAQSGENFLPRSVARDAFQAGNDLIYLGNITSEEPESDTYTATLDVLDFFAQLYKADRTFAQLVDDAVLRILTQKLRMYADDFTLANVLTPESGLESLGSSEEIVLEVARNAGTLISPDAEELSTLLPAPPNQTERIVFLTDTSDFKQCTTCLWEQGLAADAMQKAVLRLYGPTGTGQVFTSRLNVYPFEELELMLNEESQSDIEVVLESAKWIVISLTSVSDGQIELLQRFFSERSNLLRDRNVILFSFTAPYYLDPTDVSKLTAYYALYSKQPAFVEMAARLLFQQGTLQGASPVSILDLGYDLRVVTSADPDQVIPLALDQEIPVTPTAESGTLTPETPQAAATQTPVPLFRVGDTIDVRAGPVVDHNQNIVPDKTPVRFIMSTMDESGEILNQVDAETVDGVARASFEINRPGEVKIRAVSEPALISNELRITLDPSSSEGAAVTIVTPTSQITPTIQVTPTVTPTPTPTSELITPEGRPRVGIWMLVMLAVFGGAFLMFWAVSRLVSPRWGLRWALCAFLGGLAAYNYLALDFPGAANWIATSAGAFGVLMLTFSGQLIGALVAWIWMKLFSGSASPGD